MTSDSDWEVERERLLSQRISDLGLSLEGTVLEKLVTQLYVELDQRGLTFRPPVYLSDQWGCPDGTPLIGVPFYLADPRLARIEEDFALEIESENDVMRFLRHEAGHAFNYAYRLHDRADWHETFGPYSRPYRDRYRSDPFTHQYVRHILGWYAQKHPDEDFAETFAVWLTPDVDWRREYEGWGALRKLEYVDRVMRDVGQEQPKVRELTDDDLPVAAMRYTVAEHYRDLDDPLPVSDPRIFDGDLRALFGKLAEMPEKERAGGFIKAHRREIVSRIAYWTGEPAAAVRKFVDLIAARADELELAVRGREASTLIELTAFGTAVVMNFRYTDDFTGERPGE
ncbi:MAG: hypothetical protein NUW01_00945 [Gemmatimonadaceae bacterium]|nr:hypothetical protein [Gemmatimonadaceae bacterium]